MQPPVAVGLFLVLFITSAFGYLNPKSFGKTFVVMTVHAHHLCQLTTDVSQELIDGVRDGKFPDNEPSIQYYTLCLWLAAKGLDDQLRIRKDLVLPYLEEMNLSQDANVYITCNENALKSNETKPHKKIWEMQKCIQKNIDAERYIFF
ncbi:uncharacterized protein LOC130898778 [Diorhabda carinulata]|uniref:uncharacterized protein LOC130898778 n=1 Tax=Diorhabda carinulata TaxID=1163345 RepID=UPI0025A01A49|nr:uncharacterized protein LOC130898778 [Diorhabda carinulata]XP_057664269.1 uncharacterized protein LOC130898778 [Diorhabda carinulata]